MSNFRSKVPKKITISALSIVGRSLIWSAYTAGTLMFTVLYYAFQLIIYIHLYPKLSAIYIKK